MTLPNYPSPEVKKFGERVCEAIYDAEIMRSMGGLGGCKHYGPEDFEPDLIPYINAYFEGNLDSVAITYAAMRTKELELHPDGALQWPEGTKQVTSQTWHEDGTCVTEVTPMPLNPLYILVWTEGFGSLDGVYTDHYETFEDLASAMNAYWELIKLDGTYIASVTAVVHSSDYDTHPRLEHLA